MITAISQRSRFHTETLAGSKDVDLHGVTLAVADTELLVDSHLRLTAGQHYGLVGRNGVGKSSLLKAIGRGLVIGFPRHLRCLYVDQLEGVDPDDSPVAVVLATDVDAQRAQRETDALQAALEGGDAAAMAAALRALRLARLGDEVEAARQTAEHRSGERGLAARRELVAAEARLAELTAALEAAPGSEELAEAEQAVQDELDGLFERLALCEPGEAEGRARSILTGLGLSQEQQDAPIGQLSGGWRIRVALAKALFVQPDLLLLDEPTNHLDLKAIVWLTRYLDRLERSTLVLVSHDRAFLNAIAREIIVFRKRSLTYYAGNYDAYVSQRETTATQQARLAEGVERKRQHMERSIQEGLRQAHKQGDDKKLGMVASRRKKLENRLGVEKNVAGHRLRVNKDFIGYFESARQQAEVEPPDPLPVWKVPEVVPLRNKGPLLQVEGVSCGYASGKPVLRSVSLCLEQGDRVALVGPNGQGKSTLVKTLLGELPPLAGTLSRQGSARLAYFQQGQVEALAGKTGETALSYLQGLWPATKEQELRGQLGSFGIKGSTATQPLPSLSGGQVVRLALAAAFGAAPHLLVLDEPSNHLDLEGVECLAAALEAFAGGVLLVSHDQYLVKQAARRVLLVADGSVRPLEGGVDEYVASLGGKKKGSSGSAAKPGADPGAKHAAKARSKR